jgi:hypothetical protein
LKIPEREVRLVTRIWTHSAVEIVVKEQIFKSLYREEVFSPPKRVL